MWVRVKRRGEFETNAVKTTPPMSLYRPVVFVRPVSPRSIRNAGADPTLSGYSVFVLYVRRPFSLVLFKYTTARNGGRAPAGIFIVFLLVIFVRFIRPTRSLIVVKRVYRRNSINVVHACTYIFVSPSFFFFFISRSLHALRRCARVNYTRPPRQLFRAKLRVAYVRNRRTVIAANIFRRGEIKRTRKQREIIITETASRDNRDKIVHRTIIVFGDR